MDHTFEITTELPLPRQVVFEFFSDAANLQRITPPELHFEILTSLPAPMGQGAWIEYRLRLFGVPFRWLTRISEWNPPHHFVDDQLRGPYARWIHRHTFESAAGGTTIRDSVRYRLPLHPFGLLALPLVRFQLSRIFACRQEAVRECLCPAGKSV
jgi:ligand-binding SRPBCC domain-containing protein